jgi:hypothetical protein
MISALRSGTVKKPTAQMTPRNRHLFPGRFFPQLSGQARGGRQSAGTKGANATHMIGRWRPSIDGHSVE